MVGVDEAIDQNAVLRHQHVLLQRRNQLALLKFLAPVAGLRAARKHFHDDYRRMHGARVVALRVAAHHYIRIVVVLAGCQREPHVFGINLAAALADAHSQPKRAVLNQPVVLLGAAHHAFRPVEREYFALEELVANARLLFQGEVFFDGVAAGVETWIGLQLLESELAFYNSI